MYDVLNKQKQVLIAYPLTISIFFILCVGGWYQLQENRSFQLERQLHRERVALWKPIVPVGQLPVSNFVPIRTEGSEDLDVANAQAAIIVDVASQNILYSKNISQRRGIASTTKLLTAMIVIDQGRNLDEIITVPDDFYEEGTIIGCINQSFCEYEPLVSGEKVRLGDLLEAMLIASANDAATLIAQHIAGTEESFAQMMNLRAKELRLQNSNFCKASGLEVDPPLDPESCYSSVYDVARIAVTIARSAKYEQLLDIMQKKSTTFTSEDGKIEHRVDTTNRLLGEMSGVIGGKTGFTPRAGFSLVMMTQDPSGEHRVVSVVLDDPDRFIDVQTMSQWAFQSHQWK